VILFFDVNQIYIFSIDLSMSQTQNLKQIRPVGGDWINADGRTDGYTDANGRLSRLTKACLKTKQAGSSGNSSEFYPESARIEVSRISTVPTRFLVISFCPSCKSRDHNHILEHYRSFSFHTSVDIRKTSHHSPFYVLR
jgi:hypothetical protein